MKELTILNNYDKRTLRALHEVLRIDFNKPALIYSITGRFTVNSILKQAAAAGYTPDNSLMVINSYNPGDYFKSVRTATIDESGKVDIDLKYPLNHWHVKYDFEESRKKDNTFTVIICQNKDDLTSTGNTSIDFSNRFRLIPKTSYTTHRYKKNEAGETISTIEYIELANLAANGEKVKYTISTYYGQYFTDINDLIDKSGYIRHYKQSAMRMKLLNAKETRYKEEYLQTDNAAKIEALEKAIIAKKNELANLLIIANTSKEISDISRKLHYNISYFMDDFCRMKTKEANKSYGSNESFESAYNYILKRLQQIDKED